MNDHSHGFEFIFWAALFAFYVGAVLLDPCSDGSVLATTFSWPPLRCVAVVP